MAITRGSITSVHETLQLNVLENSRQLLELPTPEQNSEYHTSIVKDRNQPVSLERKLKTVRSTVRRPLFSFYKTNPSSF
jgi:hypothetical protein